MKNVIKSARKKALALTSMLAVVLGLTACSNSEGDGFGFTFGVTREITGGQAALVAVGIVVLVAIVVVIVKVVQKRK
jgi:uncharacterized membrane protein